MVINGKSVAAALVKARAAIGATVGKDAKGNFGHYATLAAVMEAIAPALAANGLALVQEVEVNGSDVTVSAALVHESGETIEFVPLTLPLGDRRTAQAAGSAITYARRYQLTALFGLAPDDDDGDAASKPSQTPQERTNGRAANSTVPAQKTQQRPATPPTGEISDDDTPPELVDIAIAQGGRAIAQGGRAIAIGDLVEVDPDGPQAAEAPRANDKTLRALHAIGTSVYGAEWNAKRHELVGAITGGRTHSSAHLTPDEARRMIAGIEAKRA